MKTGAALRTLLGRLIREDGGQDVVEYALLMAAFVLATMAAWPVVVEALKAGYNNTGTNVDALAEPLPPGGSP